MNRKAILFLAAIMTAGSAVSAAAAETFADINDVPWGGAQAYINRVYASGLMVGDINEDGERVFRAKDKTLEESEINTAMKKILNGLSSMGIELRQ